MRNCPVNQIHLFVIVAGKTRDVCAHCGAVMEAGSVSAPSKKQLLAIAEKHPWIRRTKKGWLWRRNGAWPGRRVSERDVLALAGALHLAAVEPRLADPDPETEWEKIVFGESRAQDRPSEAEA